MQACPSASWVTVRAVIVGLIALGLSRLGGSTDGIRFHEAAPVVVVGDDTELAIDGEVVELLMGVCAASDPVFAGSRLFATLEGLRCRARATPLGARRRLQLGLRLDINHGTAAALVAVPGIGPRTAAAIIAHRPYRAIEDLQAVRGIGPSKVAGWRRWLRASPPRQLWPSLSRRGDASRQRP